MATHDEAPHATRGSSDDIDALYALPADEFVAARNALVKQLKADKRKDEASEVAALRRPSVVAWALNQVARHDPDAVSILIDAARGVADAQHRVLNGGDAKALRAASAAQRGAAIEVTAPAAKLAGANNADAVVATVNAALADEALTERLRAGTLVETLDAPSGFGFGFDVGESPIAPRRRSAKPASAPKTAAPSSTGTARGDLGVGRTDELAERRARADARKAVARIEKQLAKAEDAVESASAVLESAATHMAEAREALAAAETKMHATAATYEDASSTLDDVVRARDQLAAELENVRTD